MEEMNMCVTPKVHCYPTNWYSYQTQSQVWNNLGDWVVSPLMASYWLVARSKRHKDKFYIKKIFKMPLTLGFMRP
jgi:hypothetical protein